MQISWMLPFLYWCRVVQKDLEGTLDAEALKLAGVPFGPLFGQIRMAKMWFFEDGTKIIARTLFRT